MMSTKWLTPVYVDGEQMRCEECGEPVAAAPSPGVWVHDPDALGEDAYDLNEDHAARPSENTPPPAE
jgi:hypothetical protein